MIIFSNFGLSGSLWERTTNGRPYEYDFVCVTYLPAKSQFDMIGAFNELF